MKKSAALTAIWGTGFARAYVLGSELVLLILTTTWMAPNDRGTYIAGFALLKTVAIVSSLSFGQLAIHHIGENPKNSVGVVGTNLLIGSILFPLIALFGMHVYSNYSDSFRTIYFEPFLPLLAIGLPIFVLEIFFYAFLTALGRLNTANKFIVVGKTVVWGGVLLLGLTKYSFGVAEVFALLVGGQFVIVVGYGIGVFSELRHRAIHLSINLKIFFGMLKKATQLHPSIIGTIIFGGLDVLIAFKYAGAKVASEYQIAVQLLSALSILPFAIAQYGYKLLAQYGAVVAWQRFQGMLYRALLLHCVLAAISAGIIWLIARCFLNGQYSNVGELFALLALGAIGLFLSLVMAPFWIGFGYFSTASTLTIVTGLVMLPVMHILTMRYGVTGTVVSFVIGQTLSVVTNGLFIRYLRRLHHA